MPPLKPNNTFFLIRNEKSVRIFFGRLCFRCRALQFVEFVVQRRGDAADRRAVRIETLRLVLPDVPDHFVESFREFAEVLLVKVDLVFFEREFSVLFGFFPAFGDLTIFE